MSKTLAVLILESGAGRGDLVYVRTALAKPVPGALLSTAPDLLRLKAQALEMQEPLIASGPPTDERWADIVIDGDAAEPAIIRAKADAAAEHHHSASV